MRPARADTLAPRPLADRGWVIPMDWRGACVVPLHKGKGDKCECSNSRGISLLGVVSKLYGRVLIKRVRAELNVQ